MELSGEEKKLQALFSGLKSADEETVPPFARVWKPATPRARRAFFFNPAFVAAAALLVCAVIWLAVWSRYRPPIQPAVVSVGNPAAPNVEQPTLPPPVEPSVAPPSSPSRENTTARRNRMTVRRNSIQLAANRKLKRDAKAITDWESPTSALLSSPSDALFSSLPQLNENANGLQSFLPSRPN
jgi:hypothetical protein